MNIDQKKILAKKYGEEILYFVNIVLEMYPIENIDEFIRKINDLKIEHIPMSLKDVVIKLSNDHPCVYYPKENKIFLIKKDVNSEAIYHELFHMMSSFYINGMIYSGFKQNNEEERTSIGKGINEGYTQFLKERYFGMINKERYVYAFEKHIAKHLEIITGQRKLEKLYSQSNLPGLIRELQKFSNYDNIVDFIEKVDYLSKNIKVSQNIDDLEDKLRQVFRFLLDTYIKKQTLLLNIRIIDDNNYNKNINDYIDSLSNKILLRDIEFDVLDNNLIESVLNDNNYVTNYSR